MDIQRRRETFSNNKDILYLFCSEVMEMENNTYMQNGIIYNLDGTKFEKRIKPNLLRNQVEMLIP